MGISMAAITNNVSSAMAPSTTLSTPSGSRRWRSSLASGLRAALACTIVGLVSVYSPPSLRRHLTFPAFSYVVTVIIVTDATVGTALRAAASALHATVMGAVPSVVALWLAHRTGAGESVLATAAVVALSTFAVALPESPGPVAKRIALGQIIIIYVAKFRRGEHPSHELVLVHPANVVVCTALGVVAALLAVLLPGPRLATREVVAKSRAYMETAAERVRVLVDAFLVVNNDTCADGNKSSTAACGRRRRWCMAACMSQAHRLASASAGLLQRISSVKGDSQWERAVARWWAAVGGGGVSDHLQDRIEMPIKGMEIALTAGCSYKLQQAQQTTLPSWLHQMRDQIRLALLTHHHHHSSSSSSSIKPSAMKTMNSPSPLPERHDELAPFLFLFSMDLLHRGTTLRLQSSPTATKAAEAQESAFYQLSEEEEEEELQGTSGGEEDQQEEEEEEEQPVAKTKKKKISKLLRWERVVTAVKCAVSLGLAVLLGLLFNNDHGFWSGLIVATTMTAGRESTWALGIARAHGTALGSVYGVLGCFLSQQRRLMELRFLALLPWIVLATFLKRSRAYGPAGGVAAALSAVIIVGRRYDEAPMAFTITRLVETFIGLSCTIAADLAFQPKERPSARARAQLGRCIAALRDHFSTADDSVQQKQIKMVQEQVALLNKYAAEAASEPSFLWLVPFPASCYNKVHGSLSRMAQLLGLYQRARAIVPASGHGGEDIKRFQGILSASLEEMSKPISAALFEDLEAGRKRVCGCCEDMAVVQSFLGHARESLQHQQEEEEEEEEVQQLAVLLGSIGFCMGEMMKEAQQLEAHMLDLRLQQPLAS